MSGRWDERANWGWDERGFLKPAYVCSAEDEEHGDASGKRYADAHGT